MCIVKYLEATINFLPNYCLYPVLQVICLLDTNDAESDPLNHLYWQLLLLKFPGWNWTRSLDVVWVVESAPGSDSIISSGQPHLVFLLISFANGGTCGIGSQQEPPPTSPAPMPGKNCLASC